MLSFRPSNHGAIWAGMRLTFFTETATRGSELDPELIIAHRMLMALDRAWRSGQRMESSITRILTTYRWAGYQDGEHETQHGRRPVPPTGWPGRADWRKSLHARRPVGYLLHSLRAYGLSRGKGESGPELRQEAEVPVPLAMGPQ